jgi:hypothetical protein
MDQQPEIEKPKRGRGVKSVIESIPSLDKMENFPTSPANEAQMGSCPPPGVVRATPKELALDPKTQMIMARDNSELVRIIRTFMAGGALPKSLDTEPKVIAAWQMAASLNMPPAVTIQNMAFINGTLSIWGQLPKALAERTGQLQDFKLFLVDDAFVEISVANKNLRGSPWAAVCQIKRKDRSMNEYVFSMDDAKKAGLTSKQGPWQSYTAIMLRRRATAMAIKFEFPDAVMGVQIAEYDSGEAPDLKDVTNSLDTAAEINKTLTTKE